MPHEATPLTASTSSANEPKSSYLTVPPGGTFSPVCFWFCLCFLLFHFLCFVLFCFVFFCFVFFVICIYIYISVDISIYILFDSTLLVFLISSHFFFIFFSLVSLSICRYICVFFYFLVVHTAECLSFADSEYFFFGRINTYGEDVLTGSYLSASNKKKDPSLWNNCNIFEERSFFLMSRLINQWIKYFQKQKTNDLEINALNRSRIGWLDKSQEKGRKKINQRLIKNRKDREGKKNMIIINQDQ